MPTIPIRAVAKMVVAALAAGLLAGSLGFTGIAAADSVETSGTETFGSADMWYYLQAEDQLLDLANQRRAAVGVGPLVRVPALDDHARAHALWMAQTALLEHSNVELIPGPYGARAENIGVGTTVTEVEGALAASPDHYANVTNPGLLHTGLGVVWSDGTLWVVQVFAG